MPPEMMLQLQCCTKMRLVLLGFSLTHLHSNEYRFSIHGTSSNFDMILGRTHDGGYRRSLFRS